MSKQVFDADFREALWTCWNERCFFCKRWVALEDMQIDHMVPESLLEQPELLQETLRTYGLDADFDIRGTKNLAPACAACNRRKLDHPLPAGLLMIHLGELQARVPALEQAYASVRKGKKLAQILRDITRGINQDLFTRDELQAALRRSGHIEFMRGTPEKDSWTVEPQWLRGPGESGPESAQVWLSSAALRMLERTPDLVAQLEWAVRHGLATAKRTISVIEERYEVLTRWGLRIDFHLRQNTVQVENIMLTGAAQR